MGMGNPLMGDDAIGWAVARCLERHPRLPSDVYVTWGGTDLLAAATLLDDRTRVVLLDAVEREPSGHLVPLDVNDERLDYAPGQGHTLSVTGALRLLRMLSPGLERVDVRIFGVTVPPVRSGADLSMALRERVPKLAERVLAGLASGA